MAKVRPPAPPRQENGAFRPGPPKFPEAREIWRQRRFVAGVLRKQHVPERDVPDLTQDVLVAAWEKVQHARYQPSPSASPRKALRCWLWQIAWHAASHYRERGMFAREDMHENPLDEDAALDVEPRLQARAHLRYICDLHPVMRDLIWADDAEEMASYARDWNMSISGAYKRRARALKLLDIDPADHLWWA